MKITRLYSGSDGESHFEDVEMPMSPFETSEKRSEFIKTKTSHGITHHASSTFSHLRAEERLQWVMVRVVSSAPET